MLGKRWICSSSAVRQEFGWFVGLVGVAVYLASDDWKKQSLGYWCSNGIAWRS